MSKIRRIFPGGNTSEGFYSFHDNIIGPNRNMLYILKGMPGGGKSSLMKDIGKRATNEGYSVEYHHCPSDAGSIDGLVINELKVGIVDGTPPHGIDPIYPGLIDKIIDLTQFIDTKKLEESRDEIINAKKRNKEAYRKAFSYLKSASIIYDEILVDNKKYVDSKAINMRTMDLINKVFNQDQIDFHNNGLKERHLFSAAYTPEGYVDYTNWILEGVSNVYYIKGDIGTGRSQVLCTLLKESKLRNFNAEIYYNPFRPKEIESLFIKDLDTIITTNKAGISYSKDTIDFDNYFNNSFINLEDYEMYNFLLEKGIENLKKAKNNHSILEKIYGSTIDYSRISETREKLYEDILKYK